MRKNKTKHNMPKKGEKAELSELEQNSLKKWWNKEEERVGPPKFEVTGDKSLEPKEKNPDKCGPQLLEATGSTDPDFSSTLLTQVLATFSSEDPERCGNFTCALMHGFRPRDETEGVLIAQMTGTHNLIMDYMRHAVIPGQFFKAANDYTDRAYKLMNIFLKQLEALQKYRGKTSQQKVIVEHVHIHEGGQAVVGNIENKPRGEGDGTKN